MASRMGLRCSLPRFPSLIFCTACCTTPFSTFIDVKHPQILRPWGRHKVNRRPKRVDVRSVSNFGSLVNLEPGKRHHARTTTYILDVAQILLLLVHLAAGLHSQIFTVSYNNHQFKMGRMPHVYLIRHGKSLSVLTTWYGIRLLIYVATLCSVLVETGQTEWSVNGKLVICGCFYLCSD
jgi:hypothetical protein